MWVLTLRPCLLSGRYLVLGNPRVEYGWIWVWVWVLTLRPCLLSGRYPVLGNPRAEYGWVWVMGVGAYLASLFIVREVSCSGEPPG